MGVDRIHVNKVLGAIVLDRYGIDCGGRCRTLKGTIWITVRQGALLNIEKCGNYSRTLSAAVAFLVQQLLLLLYALCTSQEDKNRI